MANNPLALAKKQHPGHYVFVLQVASPGKAVNTKSIQGLLSVPDEQGVDDFIREVQVLVLTTGRPGVLAKRAVPKGMVPIKKRKPALAAAPGPKKIRLVGEDNE